MLQLSLIPMSFVLGLRVAFLQRLIDSRLATRAPLSERARFHPYTLPSREH